MAQAERLSQRPFPPSTVILAHTSVIPSRSSVIRAKAGPYITVAHVIPIVATPTTVIPIVAKRREESKSFAPLATRLLARTALACPESHEGMRSLRIRKPQLPVPGNTLP